VTRFEDTLRERRDSYEPLTPNHVDALEAAAVVARIHPKTVYTGQTRDARTRAVAIGKLRDALARLDAGVSE
jgi:hypothetical protein